MNKILDSNRLTPNQIILDPIHNAVPQAHYLFIAVRWRIKCAANNVPIIGAISAAHRFELRLQFVNVREADLIAGTTTWGSCGLADLNGGALVLFLERLISIVPLSNL